MTTASQPSPPRSQRFTALDACGLATLAATLAGSCGHWHWLLDLAANFRWYWLVAAIFGLVASVRWPRRFAFGCLVAAAAGNGWELAPYWLPAPAAPAVRGRAPLSIVAANVLWSNPEKIRVRDWLGDRDADVVVLVELDAAWLEALESLLNRYPHRVIRTREDNFGIALLSKQPFLNADVVEFGGVPVPSIVARIEWDGSPLTIVATHPPPPAGARRAAARDAALRSIATFVAAAEDPCIVAGDLNATPWSAAFRGLVRTSGLCDTALGRGLQPTWNARLFAPRIPIDHILAPAGTIVLERTVGPDLGSDHLPVTARLSLPAAL
jgi:endonuclease/exonuclease/phosphatase (EEP) superfamily protein YafD